MPNFNSITNGRTVFVFYKTMLSQKKSIHVFCNINYDNDM